MSGGAYWDMEQNVVDLSYQEHSLGLGTIHKQRRQIFCIFDTPLPHVDSFLVLSFSNFDQFLTPTKC